MPDLKGYGRYCQVKIGDVNGFFQLFFDNLATVLSLIFVLNLTLRGFFNPTLARISGEYPGEMSIVTDEVNDVIYSRSIPGLAMTMIFGNVYYSIQGVRMMKNDPDGKPYTCLPYGVNTPGAFAFLFSIIGPTVAQTQFLTCEDTGLSMVNSSAEATAYANCWVSAINYGWSTGVTSNLVAGLISIGLGFTGHFVLKVTPVVALLTSIAAIGFTFLGLQQIGFTFAEPLAGLPTLIVMIVAYFGDVSFWHIPKAFVVVVVGIIFVWADGISTSEQLDASTQNVQFWGVNPSGGLSDWSNVGSSMGTIFPVALVAAAGTLMNVMSAELAGDKYPLVETMISDGLGTCIGALFGTPFGTSVYIGHPAYKKMDAGIWYSIFNCTIFFFFALFGVFAPLSVIIPQVAVAPLILFVGLTICQQAMVAAKPRHYPAFLIGLYPTLMDWAVIGGIDVIGIGGSQVHGFESLSKGSMMIALVLSTIVIYATDRQFIYAAMWSALGALLAAIGIIHQPEAMVSDNSDTGQKWSDPTVLYCTVDQNDDGSCSTNYEPCLNLDFQPKCAWTKTTKWRFMTAYLVVAAILAIFQLGQMVNIVKGPRKDGEEEETMNAVKGAPDTEEEPEVEGVSAKSIEMQGVSRAIHNEDAEDQIFENQVTQT